MSHLIGSSLVVFKSLPGWLVVVLVVALVAGLTEFTSNTATSSLLLPIIGDLVSTSSCLSPLTLDLVSSLDMFRYYNRMVQFYLCIDARTIDLVVCLVSTL